MGCTLDMLNFVVQARCFLNVYSEFIASTVTRLLIMALEEVFITYYFLWKLGHYSVLTNSFRKPISEIAAEKTKRIEGIPLMVTSRSRIVFRACLHSLTMFYKT